MDIIEKSISSIIKTQFPSYYQEEGSTFIQFVTEYYKWLESKTYSRDEYFCDKKSTISIKSGNNIVLGFGTLFLDSYKNNDKIGICKDDQNDEYEIYTIKQVANNTYLTLTNDKLPNFSSSKAKHGTVSLHANPLFYARRFFEIKDIDETLNEFIIYFKEKYLKNIQFDTITQTKKMVKNSLDLYRSKGTERSVDLLFKIVFGVPAKIYYPGQDLFKLSDGQWYQPKYLEVSINEDLPKFVGKQIKGLNSGATAFVESVVRKTIRGKLIDVLYISAIKGIFETNEKINTYDDLLNTNLCPIVIGSLTEILIDILGTGEGFVKGDIVDVISNNGKNAKARVNETIDTTGFINFLLIDGGYGYSANAKVLISEKMISLANVVIDANNLTNEYFTLFDNMTQPYAFLNFENANGTFSNGNMIYTYWYGNSTVTGTGKVIDVDYTSNTEGKLTVSLISGNLNATGTNNGIYTTANVVGANLSVVNGYFDMTATANVIGTTGEYELAVSGINGNFVKDEEIFQLNIFGNKIANGSFTDLKNVVVSNGVIKISNCQGVFKSSVLVRGKTSNITATVQSVGLTIGVKDITNPLKDYAGNYVTFGQSLSKAVITDLSSGAYANSAISSLLSYPETITGYFDFILELKDVALNADSWGFLENPAANLTSGEVIGEILQYSSVPIGSITSLVSVNPGEGYSVAPLVKIFEPITYHYRLPDRQKITITNATSSFVAGEIITQTSSNARGFVTSSNSSTVYIKNFRFYQNNYIQVSNSSSNTLIRGTDSGATAKVSVVEPSELYDYMGFDAQVQTYLRNSTGGIYKISVIDSGYGYLDGEVITLQKENLISGTGLTQLLTSGIGSGYYRKSGGFLSSEKRIFDAYYWQEYSYEIRSSVTLNRYFDMLRKVLHVSGTKLFGAIIFSSINTSNPNAILDVQIG